MLPGSGNHVVDYHDWLESRNEKQICKGCGQSVFNCQCEDEEKE